ncbi:GNAT family N-acetyltransferase [Rhodoferax lacus]|uniref:GNAT family N-acetyltransferase n=1 Tax=Rhodoferax lacus TaxID=2184758 RepID=A0A3E1R9I2_9BURK|nr:GNAT family N-acetyltransferase [Rhodoferax lacus]RFO96028.1 GNAT family N-acetyltransferase [Rhodoferax lacus]
MSIRNLERLFNPASVAVIGASMRPGRVGSTVWRNLLEGGFAGPLYAVNPKYTALGRIAVVPRVQDLPQVPDLAVVCTPPDTVALLVQQLASLGTRAVVLLTAGLSAAQQAEVLAAAQPALLRILGPNCIGLLSPYVHLNASFAHRDALPGELAFVSQSGALTTAMLDWAEARGIGFSHCVSLGEHLDIDFGDMLDYLASDARTRAILLYIESVTAARKFMSAARAAARNKPVIVVKAGRSRKGQQAAASHTGGLAGNDLVVDAAIARAGMLRVDSLEQLFDATEALARFRGNQADTLTLLTNGGGAGVLAVDAAEHLGVELTQLSSATLHALDALLPPNWSHGNPVDIIGDAPVQRYVQALQLLLADAACGAVLMMHAPTAIVPSAEIARALLPLATHKPPALMACWLGAQAVQEATRLFQGARVASYSTPEQAVRAFGFGVTYRRNQAQLLEAPSARPVQPEVDSRGTQTLVQQVLAGGREMLSELEAKHVLQAYGIPVVPTRRADATPQAAQQAAAQLGWPVVLKILSPDISHKSDVGGVALDLASEDAVHRAAQQMLERVRAARPDARIDGFTVQAMVHRPQAHELIVGASLDRVFGPVILFGQGGTAVEVVADRAVALPPLNAPLARALMERTRVSRLLKGFRDTPAVDMEALQGVLLAVSQLLADIPELAELDINPLLADAHGVVALDARIKVSSTAAGGEQHFAIRPYPQHLAEPCRWNGRSLTLRPIRPEDQAQHLAFLQQLAPEDVRMRVFFSQRHLEPSELARLTQIDYAREMAFVAVAPDPMNARGPEQTLGVVRALSDPDNIDAEFAIIVRSDCKGRGLGHVLLDKMVRYARANGTQNLVGMVLAENLAMRHLARSVGFVERPSDEAKVCRLVLALNGSGTELSCPAP